MGSGLSIFLLRLIPPSFFLFLFLSPHFLPFNSVFLFLLFPTNFPVFSFSPSFYVFYFPPSSPGLFYSFTFCLFSSSSCCIFPPAFGAAPYRTSLVSDAPTFLALSWGWGAWLGGRPGTPGHPGQDLEQETGEWGCLTDSYREPQGHRMGRVGAMGLCVWGAVKCVCALY